jgi:hypothetical protein
LRGGQRGHRDAGGARGVLHLRRELGVGVLKDVGRESELGCLLSLCWGVELELRAGPTRGRRVAAKPRVVSQWTSAPRKVRFERVRPGFRGPQRGQVIARNGSRRGRGSRSRWLTALIGKASVRRRLSSADCSVVESGATMRTGSFIPLVLFPAHCVVSL